MWEKMKRIYAAAIEKVIEIEIKLRGKTGREKRDAVVDYLAGLFDLSFIPNLIETPAKRWIFGHIVDLVVERLNWLNNWNFDDLSLSAEQSGGLAGTMKAETTPGQDVNDNFQSSVAFVLKWEGGKNYTGAANGKYVMKNAADLGGPTNMGITKPHLAAAYAQELVPHNNLDGLIKEEASAIYRENFWLRYSWCALTWPSCLCALDCSVNHGGFAWILQRACRELDVKLAVDGKYGPQTLAALAALSADKPRELAQAIADQRKIYYDNIVSKNASQKANLSGWYNRLRDMAVECGVKSPV